MLRKYEIMYILDQDTQDVKALSTRMNDILSKDGKVIEKSELGLIDFAYKINHKKKGNYFLVIVEATAEAIKEFQRIANIEKNVVRTLVINTENEQHYEQSTQLSKTDMTQFEEERRAKRDFKKPFVKKEYSKPESVKTEEVKAVKEEKPVEKKATVKPVKKVEEEVSHEEAHDFVSKMEEKYKEHLVKEEELHVEEVEAVQETEEVKAEKKEAAKPAVKVSAAERAKIDGSSNIDEERYELQKYSNKLRSVAIERNLPKKLQEVNLRDLTKKELIEYMRKVRAAIAK